MTSLASQLQAALDSLTPANWRKGLLFSKEKTLCMCAHGAVQAQVNPEVKLAVANLDCDAAKGYGVYAAYSFDAFDALASGISLQGIWNSRPVHVKQDRNIDGKNCGNLDANYLLGMVGLTPSFNDGPLTTFEMVQDKFREAIKLAQELGV